MINNFAGCKIDQAGRVLSVFTGSLGINCMPYKSNRGPIK